MLKIVSPPAAESNPPPDGLEALSLLEQVVSYGYRLGWSFTPLDGKKPTLPKWTTRPRATLYQSIEWAQQGNVGLRTGRASGGLVIVDCDAGADVESLNLPPTVTAITGSGGRHFYYRFDGPLRNSAGKLGPHLDIRADGGQVVLPGSVHPDTGTMYAWAPGREPWAVEIAELPPHVVEKLTPKKSTGTARRGYVGAAITAETQRVAAAAEGTRNDSLNRAAFSLGTLVGAGHVDRATVEAELRAAANAAGLDATEIEATIRSGVDAGIREPRQIPERPAPRLLAGEHEQHRVGPCIIAGGHNIINTLARGSTMPTTDDDGYRPGCEGGEPQPQTILTPGLHVTPTGAVEVGVDDFAAAVLAALPPGALYRRGTVVGQIVGAPGKRSFQPLEVDAARLLIDGVVRLAAWRASSDEEPVLVFKAASRDNASLVLAAAQTHDNVRPLTAILRYPSFDATWRVSAPGWNANGVYYDGDAVASVRDVVAIRDTLLDLVIDFPFSETADRDNFFGLLLTPLVRPAVGNVPLHLIVASLERTGKTKLAEQVCGWLLTGAAIPAGSLPINEEEIEKRVISWLLNDGALVLLDNVRANIESAALASLLTATTFTGRLLGKNQVVKLPNTLTIIGTGNNVSTSAEIAKRAIPIKLQPQDDHPEDRVDFQHPDLSAYIDSVRPHVMACLVGAIELWRDAGRPSPSLTPLGGFESWAHAVGGALALIGFTGWRTNEKLWRRRADPTGEDRKALVVAWFARYGRGPASAADLAVMARDGGLFPHCFTSTSDRAHQTSFSAKVLRKIIDQPIGDYVVRCDLAGTHSSYRLE